MCGIAGILGADSEGARELAPILLACLAHRGPDDGGVETVRAGSDKTLTLVHRRLSIIDLSPLGHQPMQDPETGNWIVYNGEIVNFRELRQELVGANLLQSAFTRWCLMEDILKKLLELISNKCLVVSIIFTNKVSVMEI